MSSNNYYAEFLAELDSPRFQALRPAQERVLQTYIDNFQEIADVAVDLPTGAGKTLIALLIAEKRRQNGEKVGDSVGEQDAGEANAARITGFGNLRGLDGRTRGGNS